MGAITAFAVGGALLSGVGAATASSKAKRDARSAKRRKDQAEAKMESIKASRQAIINPYAGTSNLTSMATDLSSNLSNPFAQLGVATKAAEIQIEQTDIALANTLDALRATGAGAGGATALAQAALQSKKGVTASIESQEKANQDKEAAGEQRLQDAKISEEQRMQNLDAAGKSFVYGENEKREGQQLERLQGQIDNQQGIKAQAGRDQTAALTGAIGGVASAAGSYFSAKA